MCGKISIACPQSVVRNNMQDLLVQFGRGRTPLLRSATMMLCLGLIASLVPTSNAADASRPEKVIKPLKIDGVIAAIHSPFSKRGELDLTKVQAQAEWLNSTGVKWIFLTGTTGESVKMNQKEREALVEEWEAVEKRFGYGIRSIVHVGCENIGTAKKLARHAKAHGASAIAAMAPSFFRPISTIALANTMALVANEVPGLPFYYYHIPHMTNVAFSDGMMGLTRAFESIGVVNYAGVKYTGLYINQGLADATELHNYESGKFEVLSGREEIMLGTLSMGITGNVGSQFNVLGDLYNYFRDTYLKGDLSKARKLQALCTSFMDVWKSNVEPGMDGFKNAVNLIPSISVGDARYPSVPFSKESEDKLRLSILKWCENETVDGWPKKSRYCRELCDADTCSA